MYYFTKSTQIILKGIAFLKGDFMSNEFCLGIILGMVGGALLINNSKKAKQLLDEGQEKVAKKLNCQKEKSND